MYVLGAGGDGRGAEGAWRGWGCPNLGPPNAPRHKPVSCVTTSRPPRTLLFDFIKKIKKNFIFLNDCIAVLITGLPVGFFVFVLFLLSLLFFLPFGLEREKVQIKRLNTDKKQKQTEKIKIIGVESGDVGRGECGGMGGWEGGWSGEAHGGEKREKVG